MYANRGANAVFVYSTPAASSPLALPGPLWDRYASAP
eukprot:CAMPEP_0118969830 /NCGR_PEP_ID=MMETSP1173-20130426/6861_1 /TAXON_ID=1034831 /ORGANISM="Rhizochromulina marina cf, Strain CCMP1243" /LENGTH=36 /DNA_ID= /DNA_START= /DNA_END= /DNA_ORIENTATION=